MVHRILSVVFAVLLMAALPAELRAQQTVIVLPPDGGAPAGRGFDGFGATPISPTAVLHSRMDAADSGAVLGFAVAIRGPEGWYRHGTRFGELPSDSLPPGVVGQWWQVGERRYTLVYDPQRLTLTVFGTTVDLRSSRVVLVTVDADRTAPVTVVSGHPVAFSMSQPESFADRFLPLAPEVRSFAGLTSP
ncbi:MAG TPA: hypothetical protein VGE02_14745 [Gemmatimonadales bacterium]